MINSCEESDDNETIYLTIKGRTIVDRRDDDGELTSLREAKEHFESGDLDSANSLIILCLLRAYELEDNKMIKEISNLSRKYNQAA